MLMSADRSPSARRAKTRYAIPLSIAAHLAIVAALAIIPLLAIGELPTPPAVVTLVIPIEPTPAPLRSPPVLRRRPGATRTDETAAPLEPPTPMQPEAGIERTDREPGPVGAKEGVPGGIDPRIGEPPAPVPGAPAPPPEPLPVGGNIKPPQKVVDAKPVYPAIAQAARVQGVVIIEAVIGTTGEVQHARILRSIPLLNEAALAAVRHWKFTPTLLNGVPVAVVMTVTVYFTLR